MFTVCRWIWLANMIFLMTWHIHARPRREEIEGFKRREMKYALHGVIWKMRFYAADYIIKMKCHSTGNVLASPHDSITSVLVYISPYHSHLRVLMRRKQKYFRYRHWHRDFDITRVSVAATKHFNRHDYHTPRRTATMPRYIMLIFRVQGYFKYTYMLLPLAVNRF